MLSALDHTWGESEAVDRVWAQVSGLAPSKVGKRVFLVLQAFMDESEGKDGIFTLAGHIASVESWAKFSAEWEQLLPQGVLSKDNVYHFKMSEMAQSDERLERVPAFYRVIENHVLFSLSLHLNVLDLKKARERIQIPSYEIDWADMLNPYIVSFRLLMDVFHEKRAELASVIPPDAKVDFYFDDRSDKEVIRRSWDKYVEARPPHIRKLFGHEPRFEDDREFLPLQGADLWAWWTRKWYSAGDVEKIGNSNFGTWGPLRNNHPKMDVSFNQDGLVGILINLIAVDLEPGTVIYDRGKLWGASPI